MKTVDIFKFNKDMAGNTYYLKPIPIKYNDKITYNPPFSFITAYPGGGVLGYGSNPLFKYFSYCIVNGELKLHIYGSSVFKMMDIKQLIPINIPKVVRVNVKVKEGFLDLNDYQIVDLDDCDINYKDKFVIKDYLEYDELIKNISEEQLYQVVCDECRIVLSYTKEQKVINGIKDLLSSMNFRMRTMKIKKIKRCLT